MISYLKQQLEKQNHVYTNFYSYTNQKNITSFHTKLLIMAAFRWMNTSEGCSFWRKIHDEWNDYVNDFFNKLVNK